MSQIRLSAEELAILRTVLFSSLFDYPLTAQELSRNMIALALDESGILHCYENSVALRKLIDFQEGYFFAAGQSWQIRQRSLREQRSRGVLESNRLLLKSVCSLPFVAMAAISGSAAHLNMDARSDLDLFLITRGRRVWTTACMILVLAKLLGRRRSLCFNFIVSDRRLVAEPEDLFTASQIVHLKPLIGSQYYLQYLLRNPSVFDYYPNRRPETIPASGYEPGPLIAACKKFWETVLTLALGPVQEIVCRLAYSRYLLSQAPTWTTPDQVVMECDCVKLHTRSHRHQVLRSFEKLVERALDSLGKTATGKEVGV